MPYADHAAKLAHGAAYRAARRQSLAAAQRGRYQKARQHEDERNQAYLAAHPVLGALLRFANSANRRARHLGMAGKIYARDLKAIVGLCVYCRGDAGSGFDHVIPLYRGGPNSLANLVPACRPCNWAKGIRTPEEWRAAAVVNRRTASLVLWRPADLARIRECLR